MSVRPNDLQPVAANELAGLRIGVTGGVGDIGAAMARAFVARGASVHLLDRLPRAEGEPAAGAVGGRYHEVDVRDRSAVDAALAAAGPLDVVFANAGIAIASPFLEITAEQWGDQIATNLTGSFNVAQSAARAMVERGGGGRIVFTGSWIQDRPWPEMAAYSSSKAAIAMLARSMALELAPHRILVNVLAPGIVDAGMARRQRLEEPHYAARAARAIPLGELQSAEQIAQAAVFLCSPASDSMTGAVLLIDGGCSLSNLDAPETA
jgi:NAD(P)-dependent dehydrogenase (short-subunit alcohol dehydrogenase family)